MTTNKERHPMQAMYFPAMEKPDPYEVQPLKATAQQFHKVILRMMPKWASEMGEGKLIAGVLSQAWADGGDSANRFFSNDRGVLEKYCTACGLNWEQVSEMYEKHCSKRKTKNV